MRRLYWLISAVLVLSASPSFSQNWYRDVTGYLEDTTSVAPSSGQRTAYYLVSASSTTDSLPLATGACRSVSIELVLDNASNAAEGYARTVDSQTGTCSSGRKLLMDIDGGGVDDVTMNGDHGGDEDADSTSENRGLMWGFGPVEFVCVDTTVAPGGSYVATWKATCS